MPEPLSPEQPSSGLGAALESATVALKQEPLKPKRTYKKRDPSKIIDGKTGLEIQAPGTPMPLNPAEIAPSMGEAWALVFMGLAKRNSCPPMCLDAAEQECMGKNTAHMIVAWFPTATGKYAVTIAALSAIGTVFAQKYAVMKEAEFARNQKSELILASQAKSEVSANPISTAVN